MALTQHDLSEVGTMMRSVFIEGFETLIAPRFDELDNRLTHVEQRLDGVEHRLDGVEQRLDKVEQRLENVERQLKEQAGVLQMHTDKLRRLGDKIDGNQSELHRRLNNMDEDIREIYRMLDELHKASPSQKKFLKLAVEKKILAVNELLLITAKEAGVALSR